MPCPCPLPQVSRTLWVLEAWTRRSLAWLDAGPPRQAVCEAGYFGFRLHDRLLDHGIPCLVTPPSLVPLKQGNRVKTDRLDSSKLAHLLAKGMLKRVWVPG